MGAKTVVWQRDVKIERYYFANFQIAKHKKTEICEVTDEPKQKNNI